MKTHAVLAFAGILSCGLMIACEEPKGPAEQLGEDLDEMFEKAGDEIETMKSEINREIERRREK